MANADINTRSTNYHAFGFLLLILFSAWWYLPGIQGSFILDDEANLNDLANISSDHFWQDVRKFSLEGKAGPAGRSVSLFTFALQAPYWANAPAFKSINLAIHLLNACLIVWLLIVWGRIQQIPLHKIQTPILFICAIWLLSPLQISTVLYVIQRMAQLSVLFTLLGLLLYSQGRYLCMQNRLLLGYSSATLGIAIMGILAILSKETGALLIVYASVLELTLWQSLKVPKYWQQWRILFLYAPVILILLYFSFFYDYSRGYALHIFNMQERLYTEARILWQYLWHIILPLNQNFSLFHDDFNVSRGVLQPWTTLTAISAWFITITLALWQRQKYPLLSFAILWYLGGHSLESSVIPLQLYFEHRNYLAILGPIAALVYFIYLQWQKFPEQRRIIHLIAGLWFSFMLFSSSQEIKLWHQPMLQGMYWAENHPKSRYAQSHVASLMIKANALEQAADYYKHMYRVFPEDTSPLLFALALDCYNPNISVTSMDLLLTHIKTSRTDGGAISAIENLYKQYVSNYCPDLLTLTLFKTILFNVLQNERWTERQKAPVYFYLAQTYVIEKEYDQALEAIDKSIDKAIGVDLINTNRSKIIKITWLIQLKRYRLAQTNITDMRQDLNAIDKISYTAQLDKMQALIQFYQKDKQAK